MSCVSDRSSSFPVARFLSLYFFFFTSSSPMKMAKGICVAFAYSSALPGFSLVVRQEIAFSLIF